MINCHTVLQQEEILINTIKENEINKNVNCRNQNIITLNGISCA